MVALVTFLGTFMRKQRSGCSCSLVCVVAIRFHSSFLPALFSLMICFDCIIERSRGAKNFFAGFCLQCCAQEPIDPETLFCKRDCNLQLGRMYPPRWESLI
jgi:hypothetical protein